MTKSTIQARSDYGRDLIPCVTLLERGEVPWLVIVVIVSIKGPANCSRTWLNGLEIGQTGSDVIACRRRPFLFACAAWGCFSKIRRGGLMKELLLNSRGIGLYHYWKWCVK